MCAYSITLLSWRDQGDYTNVQCCVSGTDLSQLSKHCRNLRPQRRTSLRNVYQMPHIVYMHSGRALLHCEADSCGRRLVPFI